MYTWEVTMQCWNSRIHRELLLFQHRASHSLLRLNPYTSHRWESSLQNASTSVVVSFSFPEGPNRGWQIFRHGSGFNFRLCVPLFELWMNGAAMRFQKQTSWQCLLGTAEMIDFFQSFSCFSFLFQDILFNLILWVWVCQNSGKNVKINENFWLKFFTFLLYNYSCFHQIGILVIFEI